MWGPLTLTHRQQVTQSFPNTHTHPVQPRAGAAAERQRAKRTGKLLYWPEREGDGERKRNPRVRKSDRVNLA